MYPLLCGRPAEELSAGHRQVRPPPVPVVCENHLLTHENDVTTFFLLVSRPLRKSMDPRSLETTLVHQIFGGYLRSQVVCLRCQRPSNTYDEFLDMSVDIMHAGSVQRALADFVRPERLDGDNRYHCERCRVKVPALKRLTVHEAPNVLTVHLKRFDPMNFASGGKIGMLPRRHGLVSGPC